MIAPGVAFWPSLGNPRYDTTREVCPQEVCPHPGSECPRRESDRPHPGSQIWRWHVECKTVLIRKVANFTEKDWCGLALTHWEVMLYELNFILWEVMLTLMPLRVARLAAHKWHQIQSMGLFLVHHMNTKDWSDWPHLGRQVTSPGGAWSVTLYRWRAGHFPREGWSLPQEGELHQKGPYLTILL